MSMERTSKCTVGAQVMRKRESFFVPLGLYAGAWISDNEVLSQNDQSASQVFKGFDRYTLQLD